LPEDFDFAAANVNAIGLLDVIEHIENYIEFLKALVAQAPVGTVFYIATPSYQSFWNDMDKISGHFRRYDKKALLDLGRKAGLSQLYFTYYFSYLTLPYFFFRIIPYRLGRKISEEDIIKGELNAHKASIILGKLFLPFHYIESWLIKNKFSIPFGNSCIAVFQKE
jgi:hypothetical protein